MVAKGEANKTRGAPEGKASRDIPKRDKALYASGVYFLHKNFPPENERLSEAHRLATWWAREETTKAGDRTLIFMNDVCYLVECFDDALNYYQVEGVVSKADFEDIYKEIKEDVRSGQIKSVQGSSDFIDKLNQSISTSQKGKPSSNSNTARYRAEDNRVQRVGESTLARRERSSSDRGRDSQSSGENQQKYSRELDTEYLAAVENGDMETAQRMVDEAANAAGYDKLFYHGSKKSGGFTEFRDWQYFTENKQYAERYTDRDKKGSLYTTYVKLENPFDTRKAKDRKLFNEIRQEYGLSDIQASGLPDWTDGYDISDYIDENGLNYDGIVLDEGGDLVNGKPVSRGES